MRLDAYSPKQHMSNTVCVFVEGYIYIYIYIYTYIYIYMYVYMYNFKL